MKTSSSVFRTVILLVSLLAATPLLAATNTWTGGGANDYWSTPGNWAGGTPGPLNATMFDDTDSGIASPGPFGTPNNVVDTTVTVLSVKYGNTNGFHTTQIPSGSILTVGGPASQLLYVGTGFDNAGVQTVYGTVLGQGSLFVTNTSGSIVIVQGSATTGPKLATLDMEGLDKFTAYVSQVRVAAENGGSSTPWYNRPNATLILAKTNFISATGSPGLWLSRNSGNGGIGEAKLGQTNAIFCDAGITVGDRKSDANTKLYFNPSFSSPSALFRNLAGTGRQTQWIIGDQSGQTSGGTTAGGTIDFSGGTVDAQVGTILVARGAGTGGTGTGTGTLTFGAGVLDVNTLDIGTQVGGPGVGTVNVNNSALLVVNTALRLTPAGGASSATLNVNGGTARINTITSGGGSTVAVNLTGGTLVLTNTAGSLASPILNLLAADATISLSVSQDVTNVFVSTLDVTGTTTNNTVNIRSLPPITGYPVQFPLVSYTSYTPLGASDFLVGAMPSTYAGYISNNIANGTLDLVVTGGPTPLKDLFWTGNLSGDWNTSTLNWRVNLAPATYNQGDFVTFDDTVINFTTVNLTTSLTPTSLTVSNNSKNYTFSGSGRLDGAVGLAKNGSGTLTLANTGVNTFSNGVSILDGTVQLSGSGDRLPTASIVTLADVSGAKLDLNNLNQTVQSLTGGGYNGGNVALGSGKLTDWGGGTYGGVISGSGQVIKTNYVTGGTLTLTNANTYSGGTIVGGFTNNTTLAVANATGSGTGSGFVWVLTNGTFSLGNGGAGGSAAAGVITNDGVVRLDRSDDFTVPNTLVGAGSLYKAGVGTALIETANTYTGGTTINGGSLRISRAAALGNGPIVVQNGSPCVLQLSNNITLVNSLTVASKPGASGQVPNIENASGTNTISGPLALTQNGAVGWGFYATAGHLRITSSNSQLDPSQTSQNTTRILQLRGDATGEWSGSINDTVSSVINLALNKDGLGTWTLSGQNNYTGPTTVNNGTLLVNGSLAAASSVTVNAGTLGGSGVISGPVTVMGTGYLAPGQSVGTLTISNSLTLYGTTIMEVSHTGCDKVTGISTLTPGGTLQVVVSGDLRGGEEFKLFDATTFSGGDFGYYDLPTLPAPLGWDYSLVPVNGTLKVTGKAFAIEPVTVSGTNLVVAVPTVAGSNYVLQVATNLTPTVYWMNQSTNAGTGSMLILNVPIESSKAQKFVRFWAY